MADSKSKKTYKQMSQELDELLEWFEESEVDVDEALAKYEQALKLINEMENYLNTAQNKIKKIQSKKT